jgi:hypothetical protein
MKSILALVGLTFFTASLAAGCTYQKYSTIAARDVSHGDSEGSAGATETPPSSDESIVPSGSADEGTQDAGTTGGTTTGGGMTGGGTTGGGTTGGNTSGQGPELEKCNEFLTCEDCATKTGCFWTDPVPPGGVKPDALDRADLNEVVSDNPSTNPPDSGGTGGSGGGGPADHDGIGCHFQGPTGGRTRMKVTIGQHNDTDEILSRDNCIML